MNKVNLLENDEGKTLAKTYDVGWKHGYKVGFKSGLYAAAGLAFIVFLEVGNFFFNRKNNGKAA
jgi:hypothetical protein